MSSNSELQNLDLIDLLSERHSLVRGISERAWNSQSDIYISNSEWYIMARIYKKQPTISYITKNVEISRQAIHKFIKNLEAKGLVEINNVENNKKEKWIQLTAWGEGCYEKNEGLKAQLEKRIADQIGVEQVQVLKDILKLDWGI
ncbi:MarR family winged helix-turn-helix transcriptional regulator [Planococcus shenhongbingii]|uniref:MarR family winged helix-turn-helix transcriptional regulator n=1 Tax=Planococcus shenhongbingii TaxID=3058398 RepID=A0ABT8NE00_9BACL|nr:MULTISPECIES: MarR family winged helix-turn-helix transcriptional regulator [unclassified Planococcus (in: firmicutes)]MDN7246120.1 MarR family winged helix-turn-helix transcriptional regulator [Planococcus sp. N017]WKA59131.1 MarR family winged helix-turn-helix transcriptional regulator [Planococcus sp. N016]